MQERKVEMNTNPRNVRNFWITLSVDGNKQIIQTGPKRKDGGFILRILMREKGCISENKFIDIQGYVDSKTGDLVLNTKAFDNENSKDDPRLIIESKR
jgi:hypothetical protein